MGFSSEKGTGVYCDCFEIPDTQAFVIRVTISMVTQFPQPWFKYQGRFDSLVLDGNQFQRFKKKISILNHEKGNGKPPHYFAKNSC